MRASSIFSKGKNFSMKWIFFLSFFGDDGFLNVQDNALRFNSLKFSSNLMFVGQDDFEFSADVSFVLPFKANGCIGACRRNFQRVVFFVTV